MNLGNQPVEILIEDVYLLVTPSPQGEEDSEDEANRAHAAKMERLENAELLHMRSQSEVATGSSTLLSLPSDHEHFPPLPPSLRTHCLRELPSLTSIFRFNYSSDLAYPFML